MERLGSRKRTETLWFRFRLKLEYIENISAEKARAVPGIFIGVGAGRGSGNI